MTGTTSNLISGATALLTAGAGGGVASLNSLTGGLNLTSTGATVTITPSGSTINLESAGGTVNATAYSVLGNNTNSTAPASSEQLIILGTPGYVTSGINYAQLTTNSNNFSQVSLQNSNSGNQSSSDYILTADDGTDSTHYADFGINNSTGATTPFTAAHAAYLYTVDNELDIAATGASGNIKFYTTGGSSPVLGATLNASQNFIVVGTITGSNLSGTNTGDQTITLTGDVTGSGTASFATTLKNTGTAATYGQVTTDAQGRVTSGVSANDVTHGGTGVATITGIIKGNGASAFTTATAGTDYPGLATANTYTSGIQYYNGATIATAVFSNGNSGTSKAINLDNGNLQSITITGAVAITQTTPTRTGSYKLLITMDGTGHVISFTGVIWPGGQPTWPSAASAKFVVSFAWDGTTYWGSGTNQTWT